MLGGPGVKGPGVKSLRRVFDLLILSDRDESCRIPADSEVDSGRTLATYYSLMQSLDSTYADLPS